MNRPTSNRSVYLIVGACGTYELSYWTVGAWTTSDAAHSEACRLEAVASAYWEERKALGEPPDTSIPDAEWEPLFDAWEAKLNALLEKYRAMGDKELDKHDQTTYAISATRLHE